MQLFFGDENLKCFIIFDELRKPLMKKLWRISRSCSRTLWEGQTETNKASFITVLLSKRYKNLLPDYMLSRSALLVISCIISTITHRLEDF
jgi:hypothetical protein